jgi:hypothetical protein
MRAKRSPRYLLTPRNLNKVKAGRYMRMSAILLGVRLRRWEVLLAIQETEFHATRGIVDVAQTHPRTSPEQQILFHHTTEAPSLSIRGMASTFSAQSFSEIECRTMMVISDTRSLCASATIMLSRYDLQRQGL